VARGHDANTLRPRRSIGPMALVQPGFAKASPGRGPASPTAFVRRRTSAGQERLRRARPAGRVSL